MLQMPSISIDIANIPPIERKLQADYPMLCKYMYLNFCCLKSRGKNSRYTENRMLNIKYILWSEKGSRKGSTITSAKLDTDLVRCCFLLSVATVERELIMKLSEFSSETSVQFLPHHFLIFFFFTPTM